MKQKLSEADLLRRMSDDIHTLKRRETGEADCAFLGWAIVWFVVFFVVAVVAVKVWALLFIKGSKL